MDTPHNTGHDSTAPQQESSTPQQPGEPATPPTGLIGRTIDWVDDRTGLKRIVAAVLYEHIPGGARWKYIWGSMLVFVFSLQVITGVLLMTVYQPSANNAWGSVYYIQYEMSMGWFIRGLHHFGSQAMIVLLPIHVLQVVFAKAYNAPREFNWWTGLALMGCVLGLGLTGYLLPWDQKGYWATSVATNIMGTTPVAGPQIQKLVVGGPEYGHQTLTRFYTLHVAILPPTVVALIALHLVLFRRHGVTVSERHRSAGIEGNFWPDQAYKDLVACLLLLGALVGVVCYAQYSGNSLGAGLDAPADPASDYPARPEWYFLFLFQLLKYFEGPIGTMVIPGAAATVLFILPLLDKALPAKLAHGVAVTAVVLGLGAAGWLTFKAIKYDSPPTEAEIAADPESARSRQKFQEQSANAKKARTEALALVKEHGIPPEGPLIGMRRIREGLMSPGEKVFVAQCKVCHGVDKHSGGENAVLDGFGTEAWTAAFLKKPDDAKFLGAYYGVTPEGSRGMMKWRADTGHRMTDDQLGAIAAVLADLRDNPKAAEAERTKDFTPLLSPALVERLGKEKTEGALKTLTATKECRRCHEFGSAGSNFIAGPTLNGYGGREWLTAFIRNSHDARFYGAGSKMPKFDAGKISDEQLSQLVAYLLRMEPAKPTEAAKADAKTKGE